MEMLNNLPILLFKNAAQWEAWLVKHGGTAGVWLKFAKKTSGIQSITYDEALDVALCYGWIDGQAKTYDELYYLQKFTHRRKKSIWSKRNVAKATGLIEAGKMQPAGLAEIEAAKKDGRWTQAYDSPSNMSVPPDFQTALDANPAAKAFFMSLNKANAYAFLWRIHTAKKPETRAARIEKYIQMLADGQKLH